MPIFHDGVSESSRALEFHHVSDLWHHPMMIFSLLLLLLLLGGREGTEGEGRERGVEKVTLIESS